MTFNEKDINLVKGVGQIAGVFTLVVAFTMIFSLVQLKSINPLDNPVLLSVKDQYDKDPENASKAEQVRALDLMARKAYFSSRRQVETGSYLLLAGAIIFIVCQRIIAGNERILPSIPGKKTDAIELKSVKRNYLLATAGFISGTAIIASFLLRNELPDIRINKKKQEIFTENISSGPDGTNYAFFRGHDGQGIAGGNGYPTEWNGETGKNIKWKIQVPKDGKSSPIIWNDKIFITGAEGSSCEVYCLDKNSGEIKWTASASDVDGEPAELPEMDNDGGMAVPTAATNGKSVCAIFANGNLVCLGMDGNKKWSVNLGTPKNSYGYSASLIMYGDDLIVKYDSNERLSLICFDTGSGSIKWETKRSGSPTWSSPVMASFGGKPQVIINGNPNVSAYDPLTGNEIWTLECMSGDVGPSVAVNSTMTYAVTDYAKLAAIKSGSVASLAWEDNAYTPDVSSPVATDKYLFVSTGNGDVACYDAQKGDTLWTKYLQEPFYASPVIADEKVYLLDRSGKMHIIKADSKFSLISEATLGERADCTPAFSDKNIYIRGRKSIYCISNN